MCVRRHRPYEMTLENDVWWTDFIPLFLFRSIVVFIYLAADIVAGSPKDQR